MKKLSRILIIAALSAVSTASYAQFDESGIAAGFFDGSKEQTLNFSEFRLPPLAVLFETAKATPQVMSLHKSSGDCRGRSGKTKEAYLLLFESSSELELWCVRLMGQ